MALIYRVILYLNQIFVSGFLLALLFPLCIAVMGKHFVTKIQENINPLSHQYCRIWSNSVAMGGPSAVACSYRSPHEPSSPTTNCPNKYRQKSDDLFLHHPSLSPSNCSPAAFCQTSGSRCWRTSRLRAESAPLCGSHTCQSKQKGKEVKTISAKNIYILLHVVNPHLAK